MKNTFETGFKFIGIALFLISCSTSITAQNPKIEYIAHSAFVIESVNGTRVLIDPYHSYRQMGFTFPEDIKADVTLITHPHYDHDASMYMSENSPISPLKVLPVNIVTQSGLQSLVINLTIPFGWSQLVLLRLHIWEIMKC